MPPIIRRLSFLLLAVALALPAAACGRKGDLKPPPGAEDSDFPRAYPQ